MNVDVEVVAGSAWTNPLMSSCYQLLLSGFSTGGPRGHPGDPPGTFQGPSGDFLGPVQDTSGDFSGTFRGPSEELLATFQETSGDVPRSLPGTFLGPPGTSQKHEWHILGISFCSFWNVQRALWEGSGTSWGIPITFLDCRSRF